MAALGIAGTFLAAAVMLVWKIGVNIDDAGRPPAVGTVLPEVTVAAGLAALLVCIPRFSAWTRGWVWSIAGAVAFLAVGQSAWLFQVEFGHPMMAPILTAISGAALLSAGGMQAQAVRSAEASAA